MKSIREAGVRTLTWALAGNRYELRAGADLVATLTWQKGMSLFAGEAAQGQWTFKRTGWLRPRVTVRRRDDATDLVTFTPTLGGVLEFPGGRNYSWTATQHAFAFKDASGEALVQMRLTQSAPVCLAAEVTLSAAALGLPDVSLLALLGWYVLVLASKDDAEGAAALLLMMVATTS
jgi:hypothetical protein